MQAQITAEREKRALIAKSEGEKQQEINLAEGEKQAAILTSEGQKQSAINKAQGEATALRVVADATAAAVNVVAEANEQGRRPAGGEPENRGRVHRRARQSRQDQQHYDRADHLADVASVVASAMTVLDRTRRRSEARVRTSYLGMHIEKEICLSMIVGTNARGLRRCAASARGAPASSPSSMRRARRW